MKIKFILAIVTLLLAFSSCQKCVTCVPYHLVSGVAQTDSRTQTIKLCDQIDIKAYETGTGFQDNRKDSVFFICK